ncbi:MAG: hypothetical protein AB7T49_19580 [Oligoflexales bacterium]
MTDINQSLAQLAISKSIPFCYSCYTRSPSGRCQTCGSDDLLREYPGCGVGDGLEWIIREIVREHLTPANTHEAFEQSIAECYPETVKIGWIEYDTATAIKELDPVSWNLAHSEWIDAEVEGGNLITFDNNNCHYWLPDVEQMICELEAESAPIAT